MGDQGKQAAGIAAAELVDDGMRLGLGTGSTVAYFLEALADRHLDVAGVPTSEATAERCRELGLSLVAIDEVDRLDLTVDGADELDHDLTLTKGGGGALVREKVVATLSDRLVVIATTDKLVERLGDTFPLPIEVVPFAVEPVARTLRSMGGDPVARDEGRYVTDNGNLILDTRFAGGIEDPAVMDVSLSLIPGVVGVGLFIELADLALLGGPDGAITELSAGDRDHDDASPTA